MNLFDSRSGTQVSHWMACGIGIAATLNNPGDVSWKHESPSEMKCFAVAVRTSWGEGIDVKVDDEEHVMTNTSK